MMLRAYKSTLVALVISASQSSLALDINLPTVSQHTGRDQYVLEVLNLALSKSNTKYSIRQIPGELTQERIIYQLKNNNRINLHWMGTSKPLEKALLPIRIPIYRGLIGYRIFIINKKNEGIFARLSTLEELQQHQGIQGIGWADTRILRDSGLKQYETSYDNTFSRLKNSSNKAYFSRGITEAFKEVNERYHNQPYLTIEKNILLTYKFALFFFTNPNNTEIHNTIESGLKKAYQDGSFVNLFYNHPTIKNAITKSQLQQRKHIHINNQNLSIDTANIPEKFWHKIYNQETN